MWTMKGYCHSGASRGCDASTFLKRAVATLREPTDQRTDDSAVGLELRTSGRRLVAALEHARRLQSLRPTSADWTTTGKHTVRNGERRSARAGERCPVPAHYRRGICRWRAGSFL